MKTRKLKFWILILIRTDILQGQALFIRVKQKILFHFRTRDRQKRQTDRKDRQAEMTDRQKRQTSRKDRQAEMTLRHNKHWQKIPKDRKGRHREIKQIDRIENTDRKDRHTDRQTDNL